MSRYSAARRRLAKLAIAAVAMLFVGAENCVFGNGTVQNGVVPCDDNGDCPVDFHCATDGKCWADGSDPDQDVDECAAGTDDCAIDATCTDLEVGFECACNPGFDGDGRTCTDIDECADGNGGCDALTVCVNASGSFACSACPSGYGGDGLSGCVENDECALGTDDCSPDAACTNDVGSFSCVCNLGFTGDGRTCTDDDECAAGADNCDGDATCTNVPGGFTCTCNNGYAGDGVTCADVDECAAGTDDCSVDAQCTNQVGDFACTCNAGFDGDGVTCTDRDECALGTDTCDPLVVCNNTAGSYTCGNCPPGYGGGGVSGCVDNDECTLGTDNCAATAACTNAPGSFSCECILPTYGSGVSCDACTVCDTDQFVGAACAPTANTACVDCDANCEACTGAGACTSCAAGFWNDGGTCVTCTPTCASGEYESVACTGGLDRECTSCTTVVGCDGALSCTGPADSQCTSCEAGTYRIDDVADVCATCAPTCASDEYESQACGGTDDRACTACDSVADCGSSVTCSGPGTSQCGGCEAEFFLIQGVADSCGACRGACAVGEWESTACAGTDDRACTTCTPVAGCNGTLSCSSDADSQCTSCEAGTYLVEGAVDTCATCAPACAAGTYESTACSGTDDRACTACDPVPGCTGTVTCSGPGTSQCSTCDPGLFLVEGTEDTCQTCAPTCAAGTYESTACNGTNDRACTGCSPVAGCTGDLTCTSPADSQCTGCGAGTFLVNGTVDTCQGCAPACAAGTFESTACSGTNDRACTACDPVPGCTGTVTCAGPGTSQCSACGPETFLVDGTFDTCATCTSACGAGEFESQACAGTNDRVCTACDNIASCSGTETCSGPGTSQCSTCDAGTFLVNGPQDTCQGCAATCAAGSYESQACSGTNDRACTGCTAVAGCTGDLSCTGPANSQCTGCGAGTFLVNGTVDTCQGCAPTCAPGTYESTACSGTTDRACTACDPVPGCTGTVTCSGPGTSQCSACGPETYLVNGPSDTCATCNAACGAGEFESQACAGTNNRTCTACDNIASCSGTETCSGPGTSQCSTCDAGTFLVNGPQDTCQGCAATCAAGSYESQACSGTNDRACTGCTAVAGCTGDLSCTGPANSQCTGCGAGTFLVNGTVDVCQGCAPTCAPGTYESTACSGTTDRACTACDPVPGCTGTVTCSGPGTSQCSSCGPEKYLVNGPSDTCATCTSACGVGQFESQACGGTNNRVCSACQPVAGCTGTLSCTSLNNEQCSACGGGTYLQNGIEDTCATCTATCSAGTYEVAACGGTQDLVCSACTDVDGCAVGETCTTAANSQCAACVSGQYLLNGTMDDCVTCSSCASNQYLVAACGAQTDTTCGSCNATCATCSGGAANQCTSCVSGRQDNNFDGTCLPTCAASGLSCGNGACSDASGTANCVCDPGWAGMNCEININDCSPNPCQNGGTCSDGINSYTCACPPGYGGANCEIASNCEIPGGAQVAWVLNIPVDANYPTAGAVSYLTDNTAALSATPFNRVGYCLELDSQQVSTEFGDFTAQDVALTKMPIGHAYDGRVPAISVATNVAGVTEVTNASGGKLELWHSNYGTAPNGVYDDDDDWANDPNVVGYGSFQVHRSPDTLLAFNQWGGGGAPDDVGLGNNPSGHPDWTFRNNANTYSTRRLTAWIRQDGAGYCGDGTPDPVLEECDDGNNLDNDGCNRACTEEPHFTLTVAGAPGGSVSVYQHYNGQGYSPSGPTLLTCTTGTCQAALPAADGNGNRFVGYRVLATPPPGTVANWLGCDRLSQDNNPNICRVEDPTGSVSVTFGPPVFSITMAGDPGGTVTVYQHYVSEGLNPSGPALMTCSTGTCQAAIPAPDGNGNSLVGYRVIGTGPSGTTVSWSNCDRVSGSSICRVNSQHESITATFTVPPPPPPVNLTINLTGAAGGSVAVYDHHYGEGPNPSPAHLLGTCSNPTCNLTVPAPSDFRGYHLTVVPPAGYGVDWTGCSRTAPGFRFLNGPHPKVGCRIDTSVGDATVTANFTTTSFTINQIGTGTGSTVVAARRSTERHPTFGGSLSTVFLTCPAGQASCTGPVGLNDWHPNHGGAEIGVRLVANPVGGATVTWVSGCQQVGGGTTRTIKDCYVDPGSVNTVTVRYDAVPAGPSCNAIRTFNPSAPSGVYLIDPTGTDPFSVYCDMTNDGGGWTKIMQYTGGDYPMSSGAIGNIATATNAADAKLADTRINVLRALGSGSTEYRIKGSLSGDNLFLRSNGPYNDVAQGFGLAHSVNHSVQACVTPVGGSCSYVAAAPAAWLDLLGYGTPGAGESCSRYFTGHPNPAPTACYGTGSATNRCLSCGNLAGYASHPSVEMWMREPIVLPTPTYAWWDAADAATLTLGGGNVVNQWRDKTGNNRHANLALGGPTLQAGAAPTGAPAISFGGRLDTASVPTIPEMTIFVAYRQSPGPSWSAIIAQSHDTYFSLRVSSCCGANGNLNFHIQNNNDAPFVSPGYGTWRVVTGVQSSAAQTTVMYVNSGTPQTATGGQQVVGVANTPIVIGDSIFGSQSMTGQIGEIRIFNSVLSASQRAIVEASLRAKWLGL